MGTATASRTTSRPDPNAMGPNGRTFSQITGTPYLSEEERKWYLAQLGRTPPLSTPTRTQGAAALVDFAAKSAADKRALQQAAGWPRYATEEQLQQNGFVKIGVSRYINPTTGESYNLQDTGLYEVGFPSSSADRQMAARLAVQMGAASPVPLQFGVKPGEPAIFGRSFQDIARMALTPGADPGTVVRSYDPFVRHYDFQNRRSLTTPSGLIDNQLIQIPSDYSTQALTRGDYGVPHLGISHRGAPAVMQLGAGGTAQVFPQAAIPESISGVAPTSGTEAHAAWNPYDGGILGAYGYTTTGDALKDAALAARIVSERDRLQSEGLSLAQANAALKPEAGPPPPGGWVVAGGGEPVPPERQIPTLARGGTFVSDDPLAFVNMNTGDVQAIASEFGQPEQITVNPLMVNPSREGVPMIGDVLVEDDPLKILAALKFGKRRAFPGRTKAYT